MPRVSSRWDRWALTIRARVEHVFAVVKRLWGFDKVRYRGLAKNATRAFVALAMANIYLARGTPVATSPCIASQERANGSYSAANEPGVPRMRPTLEQFSAQLPRFSSPEERCHCASKTVG